MSGKPDIQPDVDDSNIDTTEDSFEPKLSPEKYAEKWRQASAEAKKFRQRYAELKSRVDDFENEKLKTEGKKDEMIQKLQTKLKEIESTTKKAATSFAHRLVAKEVEAEAAKRGCIKPQALIKLADLSGIDIDDDFNVDSSSVKALLDKMQKENDFLFKKDPVPPKDGMPSSKGSKPKAIHEMTSEERRQYLLNHRSK